MVMDEVVHGDIFSKERKENWLIELELCPVEFQFWLKSLGL